jgi:hypothetical protein
MLHSVGARAFPHRTGPGDGMVHGGPPDRERWKHRPRTLYSPPRLPRPAEKEDVLPVKSRNFH